ncbi:hypothetical protein ACPESR_24850 [Nocardia testacea]|uniref:hypothetical protein n=1 Tax=Nocardia testacea TaxID=248551 RepID=UPI003C2D3507
MAPGVMHAFADTYEAVAIALSGGLLGAHLAIQRELSDGLDGQFADAANQAARKFYDQATDVQEVIRSVGLRIKAAAYGAEVVKKSVPPPPTQAPGTNTAVTTSLVDPAQIAQAVVGATDPAAAAALDRYKEEQRLVAVETMNMAYKPTYQPAGDGVPTFVPVQAPGDGSGPSVPGGISTGPNGSSTTTSAPGGDTPGSETPGANETDGEGTESAGTEEDSQTTTAGSNENPTTQQPSTTTGTPTGDPQRTTPSTTTTGSPSVSTGAPAGTPGGTPQAHTPGKTVTATPGGPNTSGSPSATATAAGTSRGMSGMPGMMSAGAGKRGENDDEHKTPDYLIQDREEELFGPRISALGGVLGADAPAAQPADDRGGRR